MKILLCLALWSLPLVLAPQDYNQLLQHWV